MGLSAKLRSAAGTQVFLEKVGSVVDQIAFFLEGEKSILDFGAGTGMFSKVLSSRGYSVTPLDVRAYSYFPDIQPIIYDGKTIPFPDNSFDAVMSMAVLHHTPDPETLVQELIRVSRKKIIILEDIVTNPLQKYYTYALDSVLNREFFGHPHTNKTDAEWRRLFAEHDLRIVRTDKLNAFGFLKNYIYYLEK